MGNPYVVDRAFFVRRKLYDAVVSLPGTAESRSSSVARVCDAAGLSRSTFYRHFRNMEDLFMGYLNDLMLDARSGVAVDLTWRQDFRFKWNTCCAVRSELLKIASFCEWGEVLSSLSGWMRGELTEAVAKAGTATRDVELDFQIETVSLCLPLLLADWFVDGRRGTDDVVMYAISVIPPRLLSLLDEC